MFWLIKDREFDSASTLPVQHQDRRAKTMAAFVGKYKFDRNENLDEYIKKMGKSRKVCQETINQVVKLFDKA